MAPTNLAEIEQFFHRISPRVLAIAADQFHGVHQLTQKRENLALADFATETDLAIEDVLAREIERVFPGDAILAEEQHATTPVTGSGRLWIIDPICGTANFAKGINFFCTNIAVAQDGLLIASCVIDHSQQRYIWSIGNQVISNRQTVVVTSKTTTGTVIEVELAATSTGSPAIKACQAEFVRRLLLETSYMPVSHASSLSGLYVALGGIDACIVHPTNVWDRAAAVFLLIQAGGVVTRADGAPWTLHSKSVLAARTPELHTELLRLLQASRSVVSSGESS